MNDKNQQSGERKDQSSDKSQVQPQQSQSGDKNRQAGAPEDKADARRQHEQAQENARKQEGDKSSSPS